MTVPATSLSSLLRSSRRRPTVGTLAVALLAAALVVLGLSPAAVAGERAGTRHGA